MNTQCLVLIFAGIVSSLCDDDAGKAVGFILIVIGMLAGVTS